MAEQVAVLERELLAQRERYNTLFALARRMRPRLDGERFLENLRTLVGPIVAATDDETGARLVEPLYNLCLELSGSELFQRSPAVLQVWQELLPAAAHRLEQEAQTLIASLTNAAYNVESEGADWQAWLVHMSRLEKQCESIAQWLELGKVAAWTCGLSHYRQSALEVAAGLPTGLLEALVPQWRAVVDDPWTTRRSASQTPFVVHKVGGFSGFGGRFRRPPWVAHAGHGHFVVEDGTDEWLLCCDGFGATLKGGADPEIEAPERTDVHVEDNGTVVWAGLKTSFPELEPVRSFAASEQVLAVTSELSHHVFLLLGPPA